MRVHTCSNNTTKNWGSAMPRYGEIRQKSSFDENGAWGNVSKKAKIGQNAYFGPIAGLQHPTSICFYCSYNAYECAQQFWERLVVFSVCADMKRFHAV